MDGKDYKVVREVNGVKEYLTMDLDVVAMKAKYYYAPRSCSYSFTLEQAETLAAVHNGQAQKE